MAEPIEHTFIGKNMAGRYQIIDGLLIHGRTSLFGIRLCKNNAVSAAS
jgi:hypothetical protein